MSTFDCCDVFVFIVSLFIEVIFASIALTIAETVVIVEYYFQSYDIGNVKGGPSPSHTGLRFHEHFHSTPV